MVKKIYLYGFIYYLVFIHILLISLIGGNLNFIVLDNNGGKMPVKCFDIPEGDKTHFSFNHKEEVNFYYLTDIFQVNNICYSIGDVFIFLGHFLFIVAIFILWIHLWTYLTYKKN